MKVKKWTGKEKISINTIVRVLNNILEIDKGTIEKLISNRIDCNKKLAKHKTVQVILLGSTKIINKKGRSRTLKQYQVGFLGILNGLFGIDKNNYGPITMWVDEDTDKIIKFKRTKTY